MTGMTKRELMIVALCGAALGWVLASAFVPAYAAIAGLALCCAAALSLARGGAG